MKADPKGENRVTCLIFHRKEKFTVKNTDFKRYRHKFLFFPLFLLGHLVYISLSFEIECHPASFVDDPTSARSNRWHLSSRRLSSPYVSSLFRSPLPLCLRSFVCFLCSLPDCHANLSLYYHVAISLDLTSYFYKQNTCFDFLVSENNIEMMQSVQQSAW